MVAVVMARSLPRPSAGRARWHPGQDPGRPSVGCVPLLVDLRGRGLTGDLTGASEGQTRQPSGTAIDGGQNG
jgi:hypothetical protein